MAEAAIDLSDLILEGEEYIAIGLDAAQNPWAPLVELYRLGCLPIGYCPTDSGVAFVVYAPEPC